MITVTRAVLHRFRQLCRRGGLHKCFRGSGGPVVTVSGGGEAVVIRCQSPDLAIEYRVPGPSDPEVIRLPLEALEACQAKDDGPVTIEARSGQRALLSWVDRGIPRQHEVEPPKNDKTIFPAVPTTFTTNAPGLWSALRDAVGVTDESNSRYALGCLHLRGREGRIEATDGRQVLVQSGYRFSWNEDVLVPGSKLLGGSDLELGNGVGVGRSDDWVGLQVGSVVILLRIQKEARFPKIDQLLPNPNGAKSRLELSEADAGFLLDVLPRLPSDSDNRPITLDLNGRVIVRCRAEETGRTTEVVPQSSPYHGEPLTLNTDRRYVERALRLGFRDFRFYGSESPVMGVAGERRYLWALLDTDSAVQPAVDPIRIEPPVTATVSRPRNTHPKEVPVTVPSSTKAAESTATQPVKRLRTHVSASTVEQAIALRDVLRNAARQAGDLARALRHQKRQARIFESTLASLKELQKAAG